jgi:hypothetical protein
MLTVMLQATEPSNGQKLMKAIQTAMLDTHLHRVEAEIELQIRALFGRCPELSGFAVQDRAAIEIVDDLSHDNDGSDEEPRLFVTDIGFSATVSLEEIEQVYALIGTAISDAMSERPEAFELLRGRTFSRTLH